MHELIDELTGIKFVADDFIVVGYGKTVEEANQDHSWADAKNVMSN